jgi:hypothetical protein
MLAALRQGELLVDWAQLQRMWISNGPSQKRTGGNIIAKLLYACEGLYFQRAS